VEFLESRKAIGTVRKRKRKRIAPTSYRSPSAAFLAILRQS
jgi:hypothetical protein